MNQKSTFYSMFMIILGVCFSIYGSTIFIEAWQSASWPTVTGTVVKSEVVETQNRNVHVFMPVIEYSYSIDDTQYSGNRISDWETTSKNRKDIEKILAPYAKDNEVNIYYSPSNPRNSLLSPGVHLSSTYWLITGILLAIAGAVSLIIERRKN